MESILKIAVAGKGGVGKTLLAASLSRILALQGKEVIAIDADPAMNLGIALGISENELSKNKPLSEQNKLIQERVNVYPDPSNPIINLKPKVDDLLETFAIKGHERIRLLVMGTVKAGGEGCLCPANTLLKTLLKYILRLDNHIIMDTEAGLEHLGRGTAKGFDHLVVVVEPGNQSLKTAWRIHDLANDIGVKDILYVANKITSDNEAKFLQEIFDKRNLKVISFIPLDLKVREADMMQKSFIDYAPESPVLKKIKTIASAISD